MNARDEFFVGFFPIPRRLRRFLLFTAAAMVLLFAVVSWLAAATREAPEPAGFRFDFGRQNVTGVLELRPYPLLRVTEGSAQLPAGRTVMLAGGGKFAPPQAAGLGGRLVTVSGVILKRGDLDMLQVAGGAEGMAAAEGDAPTLAPAEPLGRWRLAGEICDGKCLSGAMRPGRGLAHKACASLCLIGDIPPVFVSTGPVEGAEFLMMAGPDGGPIPDEAQASIGAFISVEGAVERRGDLLIFSIDPTTIEVF